MTQIHRRELRRRWQHHNRIAAIDLVAREPRALGSKYNFAVDVRADHTFDKNVDLKLRNVRNAARAVTLSTARSGVTLQAGGARLASGERLSIAAGKVVNVAARSAGTAAGKTVRRIVVDPTIDMDGRRFVARAKTFQLDVRLPVGAKRIVHASLRPTSRAVEGGRVVYRWNYPHLYPVPVRVVYHTTPHGLEVTKSVRSREGRTVEIEIALKNEGANAVSGVVVEEGLHMRHVKPAPGQAGFERSSTGKDVRLVFHGTIATIAPGQTGFVRYKLIEKAPDVDHPRARVFVGDELVAISNGITGTSD